MTSLAYMGIMLSAIVTGAVLLRLFQEKLDLAWWEKLGIGVGGFCGAGLVQEACCWIHVG